MFFFLAESANPVSPEVIFQAVPHKFDTQIHKTSQLDVGGFEVREVLLGVVGVQIPGIDARKLGEVVDHLLRSADVVIHKRGGLPLALSKLKNTIKD